MALNQTMSLASITLVVLSVNSELSLPTTSSEAEQWHTIQATGLTTFIYLANCSILPLSRLKNFPDRTPHWMVRTAMFYSSGTTSCDARVLYQSGPIDLGAWSWLLR